MSGHTPGPWKCEFDADGDHAIFAGGTLVAVTVGINDLPREVDEANGHLIAAAPRLLREQEEIAIALNLPPEAATLPSCNHLAHAARQARENAEKYFSQAAELLDALKRAERGYRNLVELGVLLEQYRPDALRYADEYAALIAKAEGR